MPWVCGGGGGIKEGWGDGILPKPLSYFYEKKLRRMSRISFMY
jgi:hypothetical protein